jgi:low affinity Fe/Cu permease
MFRPFAHRAARLMGSPFTFLVAVLIIAVWALTGHFFHYSDTWQLIINTGTTIVTFLMVFLIQNTQNRDAEAMHLKLDELVRAIGEARNSMLDVENMSDAELARLHEEFHQLQYGEIIPELKKRGQTVLEPGDATS